jgi:hypothetical protein
MLSSDLSRWEEEELYSSFFNFCRTLFEKASREKRASFLRCEVDTIIGDCKVPVECQLVLLHFLIGRAIESDLNGSYYITSTPGELRRKYTWFADCVIRYIDNEH